MGTNILSPIERVTTFNNRTGTKQAFILVIIIVRRIPIAVDLNYHKNPEICILTVSNKVLFDN